MTVAATELVSLTNGVLTARINPLGAELWSLTDAAGREYMTDADPAFWTGHAPLLFPIVGALNGGRYRLGEAVYELPKHGFARHSRFDCIAAETAAATFRLADSEATRAVYPFAFTLDMVFRLGGWTLAMTATVANRGDAPMPFSFGFHPAFALPLPGGEEQMPHEIVFASDEPLDIWRLDEAGLVAEDEGSPVVGDRLTLYPDLFERDALIWDELFSHRLEYRSQSGTPRLGIAFPDMPMLGIWQKPGARFICIEPWQGRADDAGYDGDFRDKPGVVSLDPGQSRSFRMDVTVHPG